MKEQDQKGQVDQITVVLSLLIVILKNVSKQQEVLTELIDTYNKQFLLLIHKIDHMSENTEQALAKLGAIQDKLQKIGNESSASLKLIQELKDTANANPDTPPEVLSKIDEVAAQAQVVDDLVPDAVPDTGGTGEV